MAPILGDVTTDDTKDIVKKDEVKAVEAPKSVPVQDQHMSIKQTVNTTNEMKHVNTMKLNKVAPIQTITTGETAKETQKSKAGSETTESKVTALPDTGSQNVTWLAVIFGLLGSTLLFRRKESK